MKNVEFSDVIKQANSGKKYPAIKLVKDNPEIASLVSKLVKRRDTSKFDLDKEKTAQYLDRSQLEEISNTIKTNIVDNESIVQLFPDIELSIQILISSILSPKDMTNSKLIYKVENPIVSNDLSTKINEIIKSHMNQYHHIEKDLSGMLRDSLFTKGSYVKLVIPESIVDEVINSNTLSTESLQEVFSKDFEEHLGILGSPKEQKSKITMEDMFSVGSISAYTPKIQDDDTKLQNALESLIEITDNYKILKLPKMLSKVTSAKVKGVIRGNVASESTKLTNMQVSSALYKGSNKESEHFVIMPEPSIAKRKSVSRPLVMKVSTEAIIPVYTPGDESNHIGYFMILDAEGNPVSVDVNANYSSDLQSLLSASKNTDNNGLSSLLISKAKSNLVGNKRAPTLNQITTIYGSIIERNLVSRLRNGIYNSTLKVSNSQDIYRVMLARSLEDKFTRMVYVPVELIGYLAFKYNNNGTGRSYLDDVKVLTSLRAMLLFSKVMAMTKNAINLTRVNMTLDPRDPDPEKSIEIAMHEIAKTRQQYFPLGINSPVDLVDWIQKAGFEFSFEGHPGLPDTKFDFETKNIQRDVPDSDLDELLRKQTYMAFGLSPEVVDNGFTGDFATTVIANNLLLAKRIYQLQITFTEYLGDIIRKITLSDPIIIDEIKSLVEENKESIVKGLSDDEKARYQANKDTYMDTLIEDHISLLEVDLPQPDTVTLENLSESFDQYVDSLEKAIDAVISTDSITTEMTGDIADHIDSIKSITKNYYIRKWMSTNGFLPELSEITTTDEDGNPSLDLFEISKDHIEGVIKSTIKLVTNIKPVKDDINNQLENLDKADDTDTDTESGTDDTDF